MSFTSFVSLSLLLVHYAAAASVPSTTLMPACSKTSCQYTIPKDVGGASSGTLKLWGPEGAIADISRTAGWELLECNETDNSYAQEVRMVCADPNSGNCDDLYHKTGAVGKVVRLPQSCGVNAFARLSAERPCDNQTLPDHMTGLKTPSGKQPTIMRFQLDTNFKAANASDGPVRFAITGANVPGLDNVEITDPTGARVNSRHFQSRGFFDWVKDLIDKIKDLTEFDTNTTKELPPLNIDKQFNLLDQQVSCGAISAGVKIDVGAKANALVAVGVVASGSIVPPQIDEFMLVSSLTADINGELDIAANVAGQLSSGEVTLFEAALPGLDFPGILTVGPSFQLNAEATATLDIDMDITVGINYHVDKAQFTFPPTNNSGGFTIGKTPLTLSAAPTLNATGNLEAHIIPKLNFGITALGNVAKAGVFLELDAAAGMQLGFNAGAAATIKVEQNDNPATDAIVAATASAIADVGGCMDITAGLDVNIGADAKFFNIFDVNKQASLFSKDFQLFEKCFGAATSGSTKLRRSTYARSSLERRQTGNILNLLCPAASNAKVNTVSILSGSVDPTEVKA